jgi:hypothetical protein
MALLKPNFKELAAALADEIELLGQRPRAQVDRGMQQPHLRTISPAKNDPLGPAFGEASPEPEQVVVEDWLETQLLDCQSLARRHGLARLAGILDEALDILVDQMQGPGDPPAERPIQSQ